MIFAFGGFKVNSLMYLKGLYIQKLTDIKSKFALWRIFAFGKLAFGGFKANPLMYPKWSDIQMLADNQVKFTFGGFSPLGKFNLR